METLLRLIFGHIYGQSILTGGLDSLTAPKIKELVPSIQLQTRQLDLTRVPALGEESPYQLIVMGNLFNELFTGSTDRVERRLILVKNLVARYLAPPKDS
jgi:hypothetical protein